MSVIDVMAAFNAAQTKEDYEGAKRRASKMDTVAQFAMVDTIKAARSRLLAAGVAL